MKLKKSVKELCAEADAQIETWDATTAIARQNEADVQLVDIRDVRELWREGGIPGALHAPRGMLEFWVDPESKYAKPVFQSGKRFVFFCAGGWRSALAAKTVQDMGLAPVCHIRGGFRAWKDAGGPVVPIEQKPPSLAGKPSQS
jgi:rhodanese-related sulfurtransferase